MTRVILKYLNAPILIFLILLGLSLQSTLFVAHPFYYFKPDVLLIAIIWFALKREFFEGGVLTLLVGVIAESHSSAPQGLFLNTYMFLYLSLKLMNRYLIFLSAPSLIRLTLFCFIYWKILELLFLYLLDLSSQQWMHTLFYLVPGAMSELLLAHFLFPYLEKFDWKTYKNPKAAQVLEDELRLEEEGV